MRVPILRRLPGRVRRQPPAKVAHRRKRTPSATGGKDDVAIVVQAKARVVRNLPGVAVEIAEDTRVTPVEGLRGLARDLGAVAAGLPRVTRLTRCSTVRG